MKKFIITTDSTSAIQPKDYYLLRLISWIVLIAFLNFIFGCMNYYKVVTEKKPSSERMEELKYHFNPIAYKTQKKLVQNYFILDTGNKSDFLTIKEIKNDSIFGEISNLTPAQYNYTYRDTTKASYKYSYKDRDILNRVYIFTDSLIIRDSNHVTIPIQSITKIEIYEPATVRTAGSWTVAAIAIGAGIFAIVILVAIYNAFSNPEY